MGSIGGKCHFCQIYHDDLQEDDESRHVCDVCWEEHYGDEQEYDSTS